jgi:hypothetical protein
MAQTLSSILAGFLRGPGRPRLTWYGPDGERIELSGAVLVNWVSKTTNLLVEEFDAAPETIVTVDLPAHWRTLVWALATWQSGATLQLAPATNEGVLDGAQAPGGHRASASPGSASAPSGPAATYPSDVVVTSNPARWAGTGSEAPGAELVVVSLPALARRFNGTLPPHALDAASSVMTYGDQLGYVSPTNPAAIALGRPGLPDVQYADLLEWAVAQGAASDAGVDPSEQAAERRLVTASSGPTGVASLLAEALQVWSRDGSVVVLAPSVEAELAVDHARRARLIASERITAQG